MLTWLDAHGCVKVAHHLQEWDLLTTLIGVWSGGW